MNTFVTVVNDHASLTTKQTSWALAVALGAHGPSYVADIAGLELSPDGVRALARPVDGARMAVVPLSDARVWARLNPGRDPRPWAAAYALELLAQAEAAGTPVLNRPVALWQAMSKTSLSLLPAHIIPQGLITASRDRAADWVVARGEVCVLKPALGSHGTGVTRAAPGDPDLGSKIDALLATGPVVVQEYLHAAPEGDTRVHMVDGEPLIVDGRHAAVRRIPAAGDFRSNVAAGGSPAIGVWTDTLERISQAAGPALRAAGLWHVGLDIVGDKVVEINAFSPGGLADAGAFNEREYVSALVDRFLEGSAP